MARDDVDALEILGNVPQLKDAQLWRIAHTCRIFRAREDGDDQTVDVEMSVDSVGRWMVIARDPERGLEALVVPMPGINSAVQLVPWYLLDG